MVKGKENKPVVLQVLTELEMGGVEIGTVEIAGGMQKHGITNFVASQGGRLVYDLEKIKVGHLTLPLKTKNIFKMRKNADKLAQFIRENGINIVHARSRAPAWSAYWAAKKAGVHYMTTFHGTYGLGPWGLKKLYNRVMTYGERVIAISEHIKRHILANYKISEDKIRLVHRCVNTEKFSPEAVTPERMINTVRDYNIPDDKKVLLLGGRITRWKGQHLLIEALSKVKNQNYYCIIFGNIASLFLCSFLYDETTKTSQVHIFTFCQRALYTLHKFFNGFKNNSFFYSCVFRNFVYNVSLSHFAINYNIYE